MIIYMSVSNSVENSSKLHILLATIVAGGRAQNVRSGQLLRGSFHSLFHFSSSRITLKGSACLSPSHQKMSETARMLTVSVIPVRRNNATLFETKRQRHISVLNAATKLLSHPWSPTWARLVCTCWCKVSTVKVCCVDKRVMPMRPEV